MVDYLAQIRAEEKEAAERVKLVKVSKSDLEYGEKGARLLYLDGVLRARVVAPAGWGKLSLRCYDMTGKRLYHTLVSFEAAPRYFIQAWNRYPGDFPSAEEIADKKAAQQAEEESRKLRSAELRQKRDSERSHAIEALESIRDNPAHSLSNYEREGLELALKLVKVYT